MGREEMSEKQAFFPYIIWIFPILGGFVALSFAFNINLTPPFENYEFEINVDDINEEDYVISHLLVSFDYNSSNHNISFHFYTYGEKIPAEISIYYPSKLKLKNHSLEGYEEGVVYAINDSPYGDTQNRIRIYNITESLNCDMEFLFKGKLYPNGVYALDTRHLNTTDRIVRQPYNFYARFKFLLGRYKANYPYIHNIKNSEISFINSSGDKGQTIYVKNINKPGEWGSNYNKFMIGTTNEDNRFWRDVSISLGIAFFVGGIILFFEYLPNKLINKN